MLRKKLASSYTYHRKHRKHRRNWAFWLVALMMPVAAYVYWWASTSPNILNPLPVIPPILAARPGDIIAEDSVQSFTPIETAGLIRENFGPAAPSTNTGITKITFRYRSELLSGDHVTVYARAYLPDNPRTELPIFAFATGTTGIGDKCAPSLEKPKVANWANYDSHMAMYASQGYAAVVTDYEGMRDPERIHHYMVGELEGRAVLDSIRALKRLPASRGRLDSDNVFMGGYSQGGHAVYWADKIAARYAPDITPKGVVGFGPVMSVKQTLTDVTHGANINWFGPYVLFSYQDYYAGNYGSVLLPKWRDNLARDVNANCINTNIQYWGHSPAGVYTPEFLKSVNEGTLPSLYANLERDLERNEVGAVNTSSAKRINQGGKDNVVLPRQQEAVLPNLCRNSKGPVEYKLYPDATHYDTMVRSFFDTNTWMRSVMEDRPMISTCF